MTVAFDYASERIRTDTSSPYSYDHSAAAANVRGVVVAIMHGADSTDHVTGVTYGGTALARVQTNTDTANEPGRSYLYFLGKSVPQGTRTVAVTNDGTTTDLHIVTMTVTAAEDTDCTVGGTGENQANPSVALANNTPTGRSCMSFAALYSGQTAYTDSSAGANCTNVSTSELAGNFSSRVIRQTNAGTGDFTIAYVAGTDDVAMSAILVREQTVTVAAGAKTLTIERCQPTVAITLPVTVAPGAGAITVQGQVPTVVPLSTSDLSASDTVVAVATELELSAKTISTLDGALVAATEEPNQVTAEIDAGLGTITVQGLQPIVSLPGAQEVVVEPGTAELVIERAAPTVQAICLVQPGVGNLTIARAAPTLVILAEITSEPGVGTLTVQGQVPTVTAGGVTSLDASDDVPLVASEVGLTAKTIASVDAAPLAADDLASLEAGGRVFPGAGLITLVGLQPTLLIVAERTVTPGAGLITVQGFAPGVGYDANARFGEDGVALVATESPLALRATSTVDIQVLAASEAISLAGQAFLVQPGAGSIQVIGLPPSIDLDVAAQVLASDAAGLLVDSQVADRGMVLSETAILAASDQVTELTGATLLVQPGYADIRLEPSQYRPTVNWQGLNDKTASDSVPLVGTEIELTIKTIASVDAAPFAGTEDPTSSIDLDLYDDAPAAITEITTPNGLIQPGVGTITVIGLQPALTLLIPDSWAVSPNPAELYLERLAPTVLAIALTQPGAAELLVEGGAVDLLVPVEAGLGEITLEGGQPEIVQNSIMLVAADTAPLAASFWLALERPAADDGILASTDLVDSIERVKTLTAADVAALASAETASGSGAIIQPGVGTITLRGMQPGVGIDAAWAVVPETGSITVGGCQPFVISRQVPAAGTAELVVEGGAPNVLATAEPGTAELQLQGYSPDVISRYVVTPGVGTVSVQGNTVTILASGSWPVTAEPTGTWGAQADASGVWVEVVDGSGIWEETAGASSAWSRTAGAATVWRT